MSETKKKQTMRFNDTELSFIKGTFADNDALIDTLRKFFFQGELTVAEQAILTTSLSKETIAILRKSLLPTLDFTAPMFQLVDMYTNINTQEQQPENVCNQYQAKKLASDYLEGMFSLIEGSKDKPEITLTEMMDMTGKTDMAIYICLAARNFLVQHIQMNLSTLVLLAGRKEDSVETTMEELARKAKNSSK